ncbi:hypothetical protein [Paenibacillus glycanilyticus]|uniref:Uncharacterized protein n=1 Tax=Paenibacillus glycanilyticus TaxID=126569 RepID=A0ABQ6G958_9BACL|nr:hypothetical protein [Paenibacillus glycanilyticus]GLX67486.1 hypothetical protein MU1_18310 [Paenibacillus glycanilyticus]
MDQIYPLQEEVVSHYRGMPVYIVMKDGSRHIGLLSKCAGGKLELDGDPNAATATEPEPPQQQVKSPSKKNKKNAASKSKSQANSSKSAYPVQTQSFPFDPSYYEPRPHYSYPKREAETLEFDQVALLFLLY